MKRSLHLVVYALMFSWSALVQAQTFSPSISFDDEAQIHYINTVNEDILIGRLLKVETNKIFFEGISGDTLIYNFNEVDFVGVFGADYTSTKGGGKDQRNMKKFADGRKYYNPHEMLINSTAFPMDKGSVTYSNYDLFVHKLNIALGKNMSIGAGFMLPSIFLFQTKFSVELAPNFHLGVGMDHLLAPSSFTDRQRHSRYYVVGTIGTPKLFANFSYGELFYSPSLYTNSDADLSRRHSIAFTGVGIRGKKVFSYLDVMWLMESHNGTSIVPILMIGYNKGRKEWMFGLMNNLNSSYFFNIPVVSLKYHINKK